MFALKAISRLRPKFAMTSAELEDRNGKWLDRAIDENLVMRRLEGAPGVVQLLGSMRDSENVCLVMVRSHSFTWLHYFF